MSIEMILYFISVIHNIDTAFSTTMWISFFVVLILGITYLTQSANYYDDLEYYEQNYGKRIFPEHLTKIMAFLKKLVIANLIILSINTLLPSQKTMYMMLGARVGKEVINSDISQKTMSLIEK